MKRDGLYHLVLVANNEPSHCLTWDAVSYEYALMLRNKYRNWKELLLIVHEPDNEWS